MKIPSYPNDFFDYSDGVELTNAQVNELILDGVDFMKKHRRNSCSVGTGNTRVMIELFSEGYHVIVCKSFAVHEPENT